MKKRSRENEDDDVPVGTHHGGSFRTYMNHKISKLRQLNGTNLDAAIQSTIFSNCVMFVNGVTNPPIEEIRRLVTINGGEVVGYRISSVTHLICDYWTNAQIKQELGKNRQNHVYNVTAEWVLESIKAKKRLPESVYQPKGLKSRFGANLITMFNSIKKESSIDDGTDEINIANQSNLSIHKSSPISLLTQDEEALEKNLVTSTQENFLASLPQDIRNEALVQLHNEKKISNCIEISIDSTPEVVVEIENILEKSILDDIEYIVQYIHSDHSKQGSWRSVNKIKRLDVIFSNIVQDFVASVDFNHVDNCDRLKKILENYFYWLLDNLEIELAEYLFRLVQKQLLHMQNSTHESRINQIVFRTFQQVLADFDRHVRKVLGGSFHS